MRFSEGYSIKRNKKTPDEMERLFMITEEQREFYRYSTHRAAHFENMKRHNPSTEDWCIAEDLVEGDYLMMDPAYDNGRAA